MNNSGTDDVHFVQMWVTPDTESIDPGYEQLDINGELAKGGLVPIASGKGHDAAISIRQAGAVLYGGRLHAGRDRARARRSPRPRVRPGRHGGRSQSARRRSASGDAARLTERRTRST